LAAQRVAIIGAGIGGLGTALALKNSGAEVVILERDPPPPDIEPLQAFDAWPRAGVPQFRHAHMFLARLQTTLRDHHPDLLQELLDVGLELSTVEQILPPTHYDGITPQPDDGDVLHLWGRRATFEYVLRRYVARLPNVRFMHEVKVVDLVTEATATQLRVRGVVLTRGDNQRETLEADVVVDCSGVRTKLPDLLRARGVHIDVDNNPSGFVYSCRHYKLKDPRNAPPRQEGGGNFDYLGYATFYAEHGHYALTFGCPESETELVEMIKRPDGFEALCEQLPVLRSWTRQSEPTTKVLGAGRFENRWLMYRTGKGLELLDYFAVGDSHIETNPMYGRGCASAIVQCHALAEVLQETTDPSERAREYYARSRKLLQPYFNLSVATDRIYHTRAKLHRGLPLSVPERLVNYAYENAWLPATYRSPVVAREFLKSIQMRPAAGVGMQLRVMWQMTVAWFANLVKRRSSPNATPPRAEFLRAVSTTRVHE
jgi:2-polyprenyl-6-methoxyphenol hydroxylase-like FAD-dependent oxidoreductase